MPERKSRAGVKKGTIVESCRSSYGTTFRYASSLLPSPSFYSVSSYMRIAYELSWFKFRHVRSQKIRYTLPWFSPLWNDNLTRLASPLTNFTLRPFRPRTDPLTRHDLVQGCHSQPPSIDLGGLGIFQKSTKRTLKGERWKRGQQGGLSTTILTNKRAHQQIHWTLVVARWSVCVAWVDCIRGGTVCSFCGVYICVFAGNQWGNCLFGGTT